MIISTKLNDMSGKTIIEHITSIVVVLLNRRDVCMTTKQSKLNAKAKLRTGSKQKIRSQLYYFCIEIQKCYWENLLNAKNVTARLPAELEWFFASPKNLTKCGSNERVSKIVSRKVYSWKWNAQKLVSQIPRLQGKCYILDNIMDIISNCMQKLY